MKKYLEKLEKDQNSGKESDENFFEDNDFISISLIEENSVGNYESDLFSDFNYEENNAEFYKDDWPSKSKKKTN